MPNCYLVPGYFGSSLYFDSGLTSKLWVDYASLALGWLGCARLAGDGVSPGPPDGTPLFVGGALEDYFAAAYKALASSMAGSGYSFTGWGFDWRFAIPMQPTTLAAQIRANETAADPCTIAAFSLGGLYARAVWSDLVATGDTAKVRRIVTIGSPHQGSYLPVQAWSFDYEFIWQLVALTFVAPPINTKAPHLAGTIRDPLGFINLSCTWPSMYCAFPLLGGTEAANDPNRAALYSAGNWPFVVKVQQAWLNFARNTTGPWLLSAASTPPPWVLTTIAGSGVPTVGTLRNPNFLGRYYAYDKNSDGDGVVTTGSALMPNSRQWQIGGRHNDLPLTVASSGLLARSILEVRSPPAPPPPMATMPTPIAPVLAGPPVPDFSFLSSVPHSRGDC